MGRRPDKRTFRTANLAKMGFQLGVCTGKVRYETEEQAEFEADIRFISYYKCQFGNHYHLTRKKDESQDDRTKQR